MPAVLRSIAILDYLGHHQDAGFIELSRQLDVGKAALSRLLVSLQAAEVIEHHDGRYRLLRVVGKRQRAHKSDVAPLPINKQLDRLLKILHSHIGYHCRVFLPVGRQAMRLQASSDNTTNDHSFALPLLPYHGAAQVLLAYRSTKVVAQLVKRWRLSGQQVPCDLAGTVAKLAIIREQAFALEDQEDHRNVVRLAVPIPRQRGGTPQGVLVCSGPARLAKRAKTCLPRLRDTAWQISNHLQQL